MEDTNANIDTKEVSSVKNGLLQVLSHTVA